MPKAKNETGGWSAIRPQLTQQFGDIDERFYNSGESALNELTVLLRGEARNLYSQFKDRLANVQQKASGIGWDFGDGVSDVVAQLHELGEDGTAWHILSPLS